MRVNDLKRLHFVWIFVVLGLFSHFSFAQIWNTRLICSQKYQELFDSYVEKSRDHLPLKVGIEIEGSIPKNIDRVGVANAIYRTLHQKYPYVKMDYFSNSNEFTIKYKNRIYEQREWIVKNEFSIDTHHVPLEVNSAVLKDRDDFNDFKAILREMRKLGVNPEPKSAGVHIHVDFGEAYLGEAATLQALFSEIEEELKKTFSSTGSRSRFMKPTDREIIDYLKESRIPIKENDYRNITDFILRQNRYHGLNLHSYFKFSTVEFRVFNSTFDLASLTLMADFSMKLVQGVRTKDPALMEYLTRSNDPIQLDRLASILGMKLAQPGAKKILNQILMEAEKQTQKTQKTQENPKNYVLYSHLVTVLGIGAMINQWLGSADALFNEMD